MAFLFFSCKQRLNNSALKENNISDDQAEEMLQKAFEPFVKTTSRDIHFYHWAPRSNLTNDNQSSPTDQQVSDYIHYLIGEFYQWKTERKGKSRAFFVAIDPVGTKTYGQSDWVLIQTVVPSGFRYLDMEGQKSLPNTAQQAMEKLGCTLIPYKELGIFSPQNEPCLDVAVKLVKNLNIVAMRYAYENSALPFSKICPDNRYRSALMIFDDRGIGWNKLVSFTKEDIPNSDPHYENRLLIQKIFELANSSLWPSLQGKYPSFDTANWMKENLMGCSESFPEENAIPK